MPFDEEDDDTLPNLPPKKLGLKNVSAQKSIFDDMPKKQTQEEFDKKVHNREENNANYKERAADLAIKFKKLQDDKTLPSNRSIFANDMEREVLTGMISLAVEINNDPNEENEGMGSLSWITLLFRTSLAQRDRINKLEYALMQLEKKTDTTILSEFITKEISKALDKKKISE